MVGLGEALPGVGGRGAACRVTTETVARGKPDARGTTEKYQLPTCRGAVTHTGSWSPCDTGRSRGL